ncbi:Oligosaccharide translocation protein rft1 [Orbilia oligospora]|uniref:Man(5)GlcNAc(2)-PP-dolichol translocation protein RFT1 n=1 Tax=Orbilia oligospora TaxID=2813651 RepID=A0A8H8UPZ0_ORBOL|nr:Oligosaccharide translocation protein rft1 [Orbilia oligospora]
MEPTGSTSADESPPGLSTTPVGSRKSLLNASAAGAAFLVLVQVLSRLLTFVMNQLLIRHLSPAILGQAAQLELYLMTILFFSRESLRMALQRQAEASEGTIDGAKDGDGMKSDHYNDKIIEGTTRGQAQTVVNSSYLAVPIGFMVIAALYLLQIGYTYVWPSAFGQTSSGYFRLSMGIYAIASLLELLSEPGFAVAQQRLLYGLRAGCESMAVISNCAVTLAVTLLASNFGIRTGHGYYLHQPTISVARTMWFQSIVKHLLTQGDSILVTRLATTYEQGIYALAANYGSLIARLLFKPIEETSRNLLSKLLNTDAIDDSKPGEKGNIKGEKDGSGGTKALTSESITEALTILHLILRFYIILSILIVTLGPTLAPLALRKVAGSRWADSPAAITLSNYCYYIPLLAINGITEAFVQSVATTQDLKRQTRRAVSERGVLADYVKGAGLAGVVGVVCLYSERQFFMECYRLFKRARKA